MGPVVTICLWIALEASMIASGPPRPILVLQVKDVRDVSQTKPDVIHTKNLDFAILLSQKARNELKEIQFYSKEPEVMKWTLRGRLDSNATAYTFNAEKEGPCQFLIVLLRNDNTFCPPDLTGYPADLQVIVDTKKLKAPKGEK